MSDLSNFESRSGKLTCSSEEVYTFVTDMRNFERFVTRGTISNWTADRESCSFNIAMIGTVSLKLAEKEKHTKVVYTGDALKKNDFILELGIISSAANTSEVKVVLNAELNPMLKMMASKPIARFLEMLVDEMEKFTDWKDIRE